MPNFSNLGGGQFEQQLMPRNPSLGLQDVLQLQGQLMNREVQRGDIRAARGASSFMNHLNSLKDDPVKYNAAYELGGSIPALQDAFKRAGVSYEIFDPKVSINTQEEKLIGAKEQAAVKATGENALMEGTRDQRLADVDAQAAAKETRDNSLINYQDENGNFVQKPLWEINQDKGLREQEKLAEFTIKNKAMYTPGYMRNADGDLISAVALDAMNGKGEFISKKEGDKEKIAKDSFVNDAITIAGTINREPSDVKKSIAEALEKPNTYMDNFVNTGTSQMGKLAFMQNWLKNYGAYGDSWRKGLVNHEKMMALELIQGRLSLNEVKKHPELLEERNRMLSRLENSEAATIKEKGTDGSVISHVNLPSPYYYFANYWSGLPKNIQDTVKEDRSVWDKFWHGDNDLKQGQGMVRPANSPAGKPGTYKLSNPMTLGEDNNVLNDSEDSTY